MGTARGLSVFDIFLQFFHLVTVVRIEHDVTFLGLYSVRLLEIAPSSHDDAAGHGEDKD